MDKTFEVLKELRRSGDYVSGEQLGQRLGISRAGVLRHIAKLRELGFSIDSSSRKGHLLTGGEPFCAYSVQLRMNHEMPVLFRRETGSTNDEAKSAPGAEGLVIAERQTAGRGRKQRRFSSEQGGVYLSYYLNPWEVFGEMLPQDGIKSVLFAGIAEVRMLRRFGIDARLKWPNDVLADGKKICGILSEMSAEPDRIVRIVAGIGTNVESCPDVAGAVCMRELLGGRTPGRAEVAARLADCLHEVFAEFFAEGFGPLRKEYRSVSATVGSRVRVTTEREAFEALALDVNEDGFLTVDRGNGRETVIAGDVTIRPGKED